MAPAYLTTDIVVIIVLVIVIIIIGLCAFLIHHYWTRIGVAEIWNTTKWSSMRSSFYRTLSRFSRPATSKYLDDESLSRVSIRSDDIDHFPVQQKKSTPIVTSYYIPPNVSYANETYNKPVSVIPYNQPTGPRPIRHGQSIDNVKIHNNQQSNTRYNDLASKIQKQRF